MIIEIVNLVTARCVAPCPVATIGMIADTTGRNTTMGVGAEMYPGQGAVGAHLTWCALTSVAIMDYSNIELISHSDFAPGIDQH